MNIFHVLVLSVIEGITEFLPISSTGHLILASRFLGITPTEFTKSFDIAIQLGAIGAVLVLYGKKVWTRSALLIPLLTAFLPTAVIGFVFYKVIKSYLLENVMATVIAIAAGGIVLLVIDTIFRNNKSRNSDLSKMTIGTAFIIGITQSISIVPGVSRAAATIVGGMLVGLSKEAAVEFSFLLAVPTIAAATTLDLVTTQASITPHEMILISSGFITSFASALLGIKFFVSLVKKHSFALFGVYRIILAIAYIFFIGL